VSAVLILSLLILAMTLMVVPWLFASPAAVVTLMLSSMLMLLFWCAALWYLAKRLYVKLPPGQALVRSGAGGLRVIRDGGTIVVPALHDVIRVRLDPIRIEIRSDGRDAVLSRDGFSLDVAAAFQFRVEPTPDAILQAARSLGGRTLEPAALHAMLHGRCAATMRKCATNFFESELTHRPQVLAEAAQQLAAPSMAREGLTLEGIEILNLSQTSSPVRLSATDHLITKRA
jgi:uncharacterized membrane protein YqiK